MKTHKKSFIISIIFFVLATIALAFYIAFFCATVESYMTSKQYESTGTNDFGQALGNGLGIAFGLIFSLIAGGAQLLFCAISAGCALSARRSTNGKTQTNSTILLLLNIAYIALTVISFFTLYFIVQG